MAIRLEVEYYTAVSADIQDISFLKGRDSINGMLRGPITI